MEKIQETSQLSGHENRGVIVVIMAPAVHLIQTLLKAVKSLSF